MEMFFMCSDSIHYLRSQRLRASAKEKK